jgi:hypothetical protein
MGPRLALTPKPPYPSPCAHGEKSRGWARSMPATVSNTQVNYIVLWMPAPAPAGMMARWARTVPRRSDQ